MILLEIRCISILQVLTASCLSIQRQFILQTVHKVYSWIHNWSEPIRKYLEGSNEGLMTLSRYIDWKQLLYYLVLFIFLHQGLLSAYSRDSPDFRIVVLSIHILPPDSSCISLSLFTAFVLSSRGFLFQSEYRNVDVQSSSNSACFFQ